MRTRAATATVTTVISVSMMAMAAAAGCGGPRPTPDPTSTRTSALDSDAAVEACVPTGVPDVNCDGVDDDCDGTPDQGFQDRPGVCNAFPPPCNGTLTISCVDGSLHVSECIFQPPVREVLDGIDNNCDGTIDNCDFNQWWCTACVPNTDVVFHVDRNDDLADANAAAAECLPGAMTTGQCRLRGVFRNAELLQSRGCRVIAQLDAGRNHHVGGELRLPRGNLLVQGADRETSVITATEACADPATCASLACQDLGCGLPPTCSQPVNHRLINAIAETGQAPALELRTLTLRSGNTPDLSGNTPEVSAGGVVLTGGQLLVTDSILRDNRAAGHGAGLAVFDAALLQIRDSVIRDNLNGQSVVGCHPVGPAGGQTADGAGIFVRNTASVEITRSAVINNRTADGGGAALYGTGFASITNSTFTGNEARGRGGALLISMNTDLQFNTIVGNGAGVSAFPEENAAYGAGIAVEIEQRPVGVPEIGVFGNIIADNVLCGGGGCPTHAADCAVIDGTVVDAASAFNLIGQGGLDCLPLGDPASNPASIGTASNPRPSGTLPLPAGGPISAATQVLELDDSSGAIGVYPPQGRQNPGTPSCPVDDQTQALRSPTFPCSLGAWEFTIVQNLDGDWIDANIDTMPGAFSNGFSDVDLFGATTGAIVTRGGHTVTVSDAASFADGVTVAVAADGGTTPARVSACGGVQQVTIAPGQQRTITCSRPTSCFFSSQGTTLFDRARLTGELFAGSFSFNIDARLVGRARSPGNGFLGARAVITGDATLGGVLTGNRAGVLGQLRERATVAAQALLARGGTGGTGTIDVPAGTTHTLSPGAHGQVIVRAGATLALAARGIYRFTSLTFEPDTHLDLLGANNQAVIAVDGALALGDRLRTGTGTPTPLAPGQLALYANGANVLYGHDAVVVGSLEAKNARVELQDRGVVTGCVGGRTLVVGHDVRATGP